MAKNEAKKILPWMGWILLVVILLAAGGGFLWHQALPVKLISHYGGELIWEEARQMQDCAECHEAEAFHRCSTCHDDHGAVEFAELPFFALVQVTGDVPDPGFVQVNDILPYRDQPGTHLPLLDFLHDQGIKKFESVTLTSRDGGFITITAQNINQRALLLPFSDGIRFASEDLHVSTWLKGLTGVIVVGLEKDLVIDGRQTSIGRLLLGSTKSVTVETARVMLVSEEDGEVREGLTASRLQGAALQDVISLETGSEIEVVDQEGYSSTFSARELEPAVLVPTANGTTLVLPDRARSDWFQQVKEIRTLK